MAAAMIQHFDTLGYVQEAKALGIPEEIATFQARQIEQATQIDSTDLATKSELKQEIALIRSDLKSEIATVRLEITAVEIRLIKWMIGTAIGSIITLSGLMISLFKIMH